MKQDDRKAALILWGIGVIPVIWLALAMAPAVRDGLPAILDRLVLASGRPLSIELCGDSLRTVLALLSVYGLALAIYISSEKNYRHREEHGSARWGSPAAIRRKYAQNPESSNRLLTQNTAIGLNAQQHNRNLNTLVCGGSGAGKTRFYCKPNLMQANTSYFILDPNDEIYIQYFSKGVPRA